MWREGGLREGVFSGEPAVEGGEPAGGLQGRKGGRQICTGPAGRDGEEPAGSLQGRRKGACRVDWVCCVDLVGQASCPSTDGRIKRQGAQGGKHTSLANAHMLLSLIAAAAVFADGPTLCCEGCSRKCGAGSSEPDGCAVNMYGIRLA